MSVTLTNLQQQFDHPRQWLATNGLGGYALGTEAGWNARRYDGLLIAAAAPPLQRVLVLHSVIDRLVWPDQRTMHLATQRFGADAMLHPDGCARMVSLTIDPPHRVVWRFQFDQTHITRQLLLHEDRNAATLTWQIREPHPPCVLMVRPLTPLRSFHELDHAAQHNDRAPLAINWPHRHAAHIQRDELQATIHTPAGSWRQEPQWWYDFAYLYDQQRGQAWREDVYSPGDVHWHIWSHGDAHCEMTIELVAPALPPVDNATTAVATDCPADGVAITLRADSEHAARIGERNVWQRLECAADQFIVRRLLQPGDARVWGRSIIAGYPWFSDWGRDAMICVPGLLLSRGKFAEAASVLQTFADAMQNGLIPNCFDDGTGSPLYNSVDAGLWFVHAVWLLRDAPIASVPAAQQLMLRRACCSIIDAYRDGTRFGIRCDAEDHLLIAGDDAHALTWMDAVRDGQRFTPRVGKPVEINALWHHALCCTADLLAMDKHALPQQQEYADQCRTHAGRVRESFAAFWCDAEQCLHDTLKPETVSTSPARWQGDATMRPNQLFAVALPHALLSAQQQRAVVDSVQQHLLTPCGIRTLHPDHADYRGRYEGDMRSRDAAYHQGTVWPWLLGPYCEAMLRAYDYASHAQRHARKIIERVAAEEIDRGCFGQIAEVYDGDEPQRPDGCLAQAWSVAELLRMRALLAE